MPAHVVGILVVAIMLYSCGGRPVPSSGAKVQEQRPTFQRSDDPVVVGYLSESKEKEAWYAFIKDGRYRWARPDDFRFPGWATASSDAGRSRMFPFQGGDINQDGAFNDFALIVVDTTRQDDPDRFGLVIFNDPGKSEEPYSMHWLFRDTDLSTTALYWSSDGLGVTRYAEEGYSWDCTAKWNAHKQEYSCALRKVPRRW